MKIVINKRHGGFSVSKEAAQYMADDGCKQAKAELAHYEKEGTWYGFGSSDKFGEYKRDSPFLVKAVGFLGNKANGEGAGLKIVEIPDGVEWQIDDFAGAETIHEKHRTWG